MIPVIDFHKGKMGVAKTNPPGFKERRALGSAVDGFGAASMGVVMDSDAAVYWPVRSRSAWV
jgi:hypothetical protein